VKIGVLGTGVVGTTLANELVRGGHDVRMGSRAAGPGKAAEWAASAGAGASHGTFADAAAFGDVALNCTSGVASLEALELAGADNLRGKILIDLANPLDFSRGMPPTLTVSNDDSLGEQIQRAFPDTRVVKTLNTVNCEVMVDPRLVPGDHDLFLCGDDAAAKAQVAAWLSEWFGWKPANLIDLGDITTARGTEMLLPLWIRLMVANGGPYFNFRVVRGAAPA
jgi:hypothetical protein